jgi:hypothetical protein
MAAKNPAAPPPTMTMRGGFMFFLMSENPAWSARIHVAARKLKISPRQFEWSAAVSETSRSSFDALRLTLRAQPRSEEFQIRAIEQFAGWRRNFDLISCARKFENKFMAAKVQIPDELKKDLPPTKWGKILSATPVVMAVIATMLAGLASSEMTHAQYDRSLAAQLQSKAGDQWSYYQAKKLRSAVAHNTLDLLAATSDVQSLDATILSNADAATVAAFTKNELPAAAPAKFADNVQTALDAVENSKPETEITADLASVKDADLAAALNAATQAALDFDNATKSINKTSDKLDEALMSGDKNIFRSFSAARLRYTAARYDAESRLNLAVASVYELQVRKSNISAERHHKRSGKFFYGMLGAQLAVIIATFAIAARQRNFLWSLAAAAGLIAVSFAAYVYLYV